ncbi:UNVERIFIED_CONTAM: hypothetical protein RMT77_005124 [Armadillidium vulgare]
MEAQCEEIIRPSITIEDVSTLAKKIFGIWTSSVIEFNSYDDKNFLIEVSRCENPFMEETAGKKFVLKVLNSRDSENEENVEAQNEVMQYLSKSNLGVVVPIPLKNMNGKFIAKETFLTENETAKVNRKHVVRLFEYLPGKLMKDVVYTDELCYEVGQIVGRLYNALKNYENQVIKERKSLWQLESLLTLHDYLYVITDETKVSLLKEILCAWEEIVAPVISSLEKGIIHGDLNEQNILVATTPQKENPFRHIFGILDFGDANYSPFIFELCIAITYIMIEVNVMDPIEASGFVIAGYASERDVSDTEFGLLKECIAARFAQSLTLGAYSYLKDPSNVYLLCTAKSGWEKLFILWQTPKEELVSKWKKISKSFRPCQEAKH